MRASPVYKDLVLVGGGHSHVAVLKRFGMRPIPGVRLTLISPTVQAPYSGMLPGLVAGHYGFDEAHIDLVPLCRFAQARLIVATANGIDPRARQVRIGDRPPVPFDVVSLNTGSTPTMPDRVSGLPNVTPVKPVDGFLERWQSILERPRQTPLRITVVGAGAGGVELALAMSARLRGDGRAFEIGIVTADESIVPTHNRGARRRLEAALGRHRIGVRTSARASEATSSALVLESGERIDTDEVIWVTQASAPGWLAASGLAVDPRGFLIIDETLRSVSDGRVFAAGDVASMERHPRPKSGVFAVRQGKPLADNLRAALLGRSLGRYRPQREFLSLIGTGDGSAVASRGSWSCGGPLVWRLKERIDRRFMERFQVLPEMKTVPRAEGREVPPAVTDGKPVASASAPMRCGGCGAKTAATVLDAALAGLVTRSRGDIVAGLAAPDDAALIRVPAGRLVALSIDAFRPMVDDPYLFGRITANHCLNDLFAMGASPQSALAIVSLPDWPEAKLIDELKQMLAGAALELERADAVLVGGHTSEAAEISLGFSVTGLLDDAPLSKRGIEAGDRLVLTKPLGTGAVLAAAMQGRARGRWLEAAIAAMLQSNESAARILREADVHACTDVTGFGLLGHLLEMARPAAASIAIDMNALPAIDGARDCLDAGIRSTMDPKNAALAKNPETAPALTSDAAAGLLFDPQTAGGLLAAIPANRVEECLQALRAEGFADAAVIGRVDATGLAAGARIG